MRMMRGLIMDRLAIRLLWLRLRQRLSLWDRRKMGLLMSKLTLWLHRLLSLLVSLKTGIDRRLCIIELLTSLGLQWRVARL